MLTLLRAAIIIAQILVVCFITISSASIVLGAEDSISCSSIKDSHQRLLCYDNRNNTPEVADLDGTLPDTSSAENPVSILQDRIKKEEVINYNKFAITPHKPNYILPLTYNNSPNTQAYDSETLDDKFAGNIDNHEVKFQLSFKIPLVRKFLHSDSSLWFAYSQVAFWQMYNLDASSPFRETNYEPELIWVNKTDFQFFGFKNSLITLSLNHQSNGQAKPLSRSWNRLVANFILEKNNTILSFKPWYRFPESSKNDGNPDIEKYLGYAEFAVLQKYKEHLSTIMLRNNMHSDNKTTAELTYTFKFTDRFKGIAQYFNGYGESLIDYNHRVRRLGIGILITDWL
jgi:phospholipase A1